MNWPLVSRFVFFLVLVGSSFGTLSSAVAITGETGLPIPRFVSLKSDRVNMRLGPGWDYAVVWVFHRKGLPVEIISEFGWWRQVRDSEGDEGWIHHSLLDGVRHVLVKRTQDGTLAPLYEADEGKDRVAQVQLGVVGRLLECNSTRCRVSVSGERGWIDKTQLWGVYPHEELE
ncbi:MAG: SH3 domain-containing protein [Parvularculales bacterium]